MGRSADVPKSVDALGGDDFGCHILHVDMDAFFASVEIQRRPELRGKPVAVGGQRRGVVAAASYEARTFGVRSAMPMTQARRLCPQLMIIPPDGAAYRTASATVMAILRDVTPLVQPVSLDEAFLDISGAERLLGRPAAIAGSIRARVRADTGLTCSVGVASTKFVAKLASARCKPDGLLVVPAAKTLQFLHPLPATVLSGVGAKTAETLHRLGIVTVADLAETPRHTLQHAVGPSAAAHLHDLARGVDPRRVQVGEAEKSVSADRTMAVDLTTTEAVNRELLRVAGEVGRRLRAKKLQARTVGIKIRFADFRTVTRVRTVTSPVDATEVLHRVAVALFADLGLTDPHVRLVGVKAENLVETESLAEQLELFSQNPLLRRERRGVSAVVDAAREKFGPAGLVPAALLGRRLETDPTRNLDE